MLVTRSNFKSVLKEIYSSPLISFDTETTGLRPYHGDRLFSFMMAIPKSEVFYFNFNAYPGISEEELLPRSAIQDMIPLFSDPTKLWIGHNLKFDLHMLWQEGIEIKGSLHDTMVTMRVIDPDRLKYSLDACSKDLLGEDKDDAVKKYCDKEGLWDKVKIPGKDKEEKRYHYEKVPFGLIVPYGEKDAQLTLKLYYKQIEMLQGIHDEMIARHPHLPGIMNIYKNECKLLPVVWDMERRGIKIDLGYTQKAINYYTLQMEDSKFQFETITEIPFKDSGKVFQEVFKSEQSKWVMTKEKKQKKPRVKPFQPQPCFDSDILAMFTNSAAKEILRYRDAKSHSDFFQGFLYHADSNAYVHYSLDQDGTSTGRFSSRAPNMQNLSNDSEELQEQEYPVRKAIITPSEDYYLFSIDYKAMEYRMLIHYAKELGWAKAIREGQDPHEYVKNMINDNLPRNYLINRSKAKNCSFAKIYGCGVSKLASMIKMPEEITQIISDAYFESLPNVKKFLFSVVKTTKTRGYIINWMGRKRVFRDPNLAYKAPNSLIQGGCADVVKVVMPRVSDVLKGTKSSMSLQVHDELNLYMHRDDLHLLPTIKMIMETAFPGEILPLEVSHEWGRHNLYDLEGGMPDGR